MKIKTLSTFVAVAVLMAGVSLISSTQAAGTNLVTNGDLEAGTTAPTGWTQDSWGTLAATFTYPVAGNGSAKAAQVKIASRTDGDAKWMHTAIPVTPGTTYTYSESYSATAATEVDIEYTSTSGAVSYVWVGDAPATGATWGTFTNTITVPAGMKSMTVMHVIAAVGTLTIDNVSIIDGTTPPPPPPPPAAPTISTFTATPSAISSGQTSTLAWSTANATSLALSTSDEAHASTVSGSSSVVSPTATTTYTLFAYNGGTATTSKQVTVNVATVVAPPPPPPPAQKPTISSFIATPASITAGSSTVLSWSVTNASSTSISGVGVVTGTSKSVTPTQTTQYILTATNPAGSVTATTTVTVTTPPPPPSSNPITNGTFEAGTTNAPTGWNADYWGTLTPTFTYPVTGKGGGKAAKVTVTNWKSGDAKWWFNHISVSSNTVYKFTEDYMGSVISNVTVEFLMSNGTYQYQWVANAPVATTWAPLSVEVTVPRGAVSMTVLHALDKNGTLTIDNASLVALPANPFPTGMITLTFDDGLKSQFTNARPILNTAGIKAGYYIITTEPASGDTGYMTWANITTLKTEGNEVGGHTRTHPDLSAISAAAAQTEIKGSYDDLVAQGFTPKAFVYPVGGVNPAVETMVKNAGYTVARGSYWGMNTPTADKLALYDLRLDKTTTFAQAKTWIDQAIADKRWVIFELHDVLASGGDEYAISTALFQQIVSYIKSSGIKTTTLEQGRALMQ